MQSHPLCMVLNTLILINVTEYCSHQLLLKLTNRSSHNGWNNDIVLHPVLIILQYRSVFQSSNLIGWVRVY